MTAFETVRTLGADGQPLAVPTDAIRARATALRVLNATVLAAWATVSPEGQAHVNIGYFAYSESLTLYLLSHPNSRHCRNLRVNPSMAVAVFASNQSWTEPGRGIQLFGRCEQVTDALAPE